MFTSADRACRAARRTSARSVIAAVAAVVGLAATACVPANTRPGPLNGILILVDPGHNRDNAAHLSEINKLVNAGGFMKPCNTTGTATSSGVPESAINWAISSAVRSKLEALGATVAMTRQGDAGWGPCVDARGAYAHLINAHLLVSIHADGATATHSGFHVIRPGLVKGYTDAMVTPSSRLATAVRDALKASGRPTATYAGSNGIDVRTDLGTLNRAGRPAIMVEYGNLKNSGDAALLTSASGQSKSADALVAGIRAYLGK